MSDKLISANALAQGVKNWGKIKGREGASDVFLYAINNAPAVDAVEVVRCGKCRYWGAMNNGSRINKGRTDGCCRVLMECRLAERYMTERNHFCGYGERREDNAVD